MTEWPRNLTLSEQRHPIWSHLRWYIWARLNQADSRALIHLIIDDLVPTAWLSEQVAQGLVCFYELGGYELRVRFPRGSRGSEIFDELDDRLIHDRFEIHIELNNRRRLLCATLIDGEPSPTTNALPAPSNS